MMTNCSDRFTMIESRHRCCSLHIRKKLARTVTHLEPISSRLKGSGRIFIRALWFARVRPPFVPFA